MRFADRRYFNFQHEKLNANDFFYEKDGIDKPKARRNEGGFTVGGPIRQNRFFFFGGYQRTQAETGFVPTASSITALPQALQLIQGARTKENVLAAFAALNPAILQSIPKAQCASPTDTACISDVALNLLNLRNPVTGDFVIAAPRAGGDGHRQRHHRRRVGRRQSVRPPAERRAGGVHAGPVHAETGRAAHRRTTGSAPRCSTRSSRDSIRSRIRPASRRRSR